ncbi:MULTISPECIES: cytochrome-c peroxidase [unclassified Olleya]|jgi:cytochrome c peroxidase|uniref:cytochrome-c peroxidase n=1 Tax=unclassified Olleya TaxID=2615019 RepID=UPI0011A70790|nr:cytochrome c peroxidase [Olleya sp. Hel_I_94]TVZ47083.1 cytochrome c peroxidase [Olleya sp. Hel_I_94]
MKKLSLIILGLVTLFACSNSTDTANYVPIPLQLDLPSNFPDITYNLDNNPITDAGFELGKRLFYEGKLSSNGAIACAFCHEQAFAFTHHGHNLSHGVNGGIGLRNAQPIQNLAYQTSFMWDGAASHLDLQPILPITSELEMGETLSNVIVKLQQDSYYQEQFAKAFDGGEVNTENMLKALSQFMLMMISSNSKYDKYVRQEDNVTLTTTELDGLNTFQNKCSSCHASDLFTDQTFRNNGLPINPQLNDKGRFNILENPDDLYKFKVPSLRNVEVSYPYMHDGRFSTLEVVLDFYNSGIVDNGNVDASLQKTDGTYGISLSAYEKESLIAFLKTLTDNQFLEDERFAEY